MAEELLTNSDNGDGEFTGKDPITGRFVKGNTLQGSREGIRNFNTIYREALMKVATEAGTSLDDVESDLVKVAIDQAKKGDYRFYQDLMDRLNGKPVTRSENLNITKDLDKLPSEDKERLKGLLNE